jgi:Ca2+-binding RTX toxin-like protein
MRRRHLLALALAILTIAPATAADAAACVEGPPSVLAVTASDEQVRLSVGAGGDIQMNGTPCGTATTTTTDFIQVSGTGSTPESVIVDLSGGQFAPGASVEPTGIPEIEIEVTLEDDDGDELVVTGGDADETIRAAAEGVELTADDDLDVAHDGAELVLAGGPGADAVRGDGAAGSGPTTEPLEVQGGEGADLLVGGTGNDLMLGDAGDDLLEAGPGDDVLAGGVGIDAASYTSAPSSITASLSAGRAIGWGADLLLGVEDLIGTPHPDRLFGDEFPNRIIGGGSRDRITGDKSADVLIGQTGRDFFRPGGGPDTVVGGEGQDTLTLRSAPRRARIDLSRREAFGDGHDRLSSIESAVGSRRDDLIIGSDARNHRLVGTQGDDVILGLGGNDRVRGGPGDDRLEGGSGDDELDGGAGVDLLIGGPGRDFLKVSPGRDRRID